MMETLGNFTIKTATSIFLSPFSAFLSCCMIWGNSMPLKFYLFMWNLTNNNLAIESARQYSVFYLIFRCYCGQGLDCIDYIFFLCLFDRALWSKVAHYIGFLNILGLLFPLSRVPYLLVISQEEEEVYTIKNHTMNHILVPLDNSLLFLF